MHIGLVLAAPRRVPIRPGTLDQRPPDAAVSGFGDAGAAHRVASRSLAWHQAGTAHELARIAGQATRLTADIRSCRHCVPVRAIQKMVSRSRRGSRASRPPRGRRTTKGSKKDHSSSVRKPRIKADRHARDRLGLTTAPGWDGLGRQSVQAT